MNVPAAPQAGRPPAPKAPPPPTPEDADREFMSDAKAAVMQDARPLALAVLYFTAFFLIVAVAWASWATLDEVVVGVGKIVPSSQVQVIQNLEGGILSELSVTEGQVVDKEDRKSV